MPLCLLAGFKKFGAIVGVVDIPTDGSLCQLLLGTGITFLKSKCQWLPVKIACSTHSAVRLLALALCKILQSLRLAAEAAFYLDQLGIATALDTGNAEVDILAMGLDRRTRSGQLRARVFSMALPVVAAPASDPALC